MWAGEESDGMVAERCEVANCLIHSGGVVEENGAGFGIVEFELGQNNGHAAVRELIEDGLFFTEGHNGNAVDPCAPTCGARMQPARRESLLWS